jgi:hypothetical protein
MVRRASGRARAATPLESMKSMKSCQVDDEHLVPGRGRREAGAYRSRICDV